MLLKWCMYASVSAEGLELKSHHVLLFPPAPSTTNAFYPRGTLFNMRELTLKVEYIVFVGRYYLWCVCHFFQPPARCFFFGLHLFSMYGFIFLSFKLLSSSRWTRSTCNCCLVNPRLGRRRLREKGFYIWYTWKTSTRNTAYSVNHDTQFPSRRRFRVFKKEQHEHFLAVEQTCKLFFLNHG